MWQFKFRNMFRKKQEIYCSNHAKFMEISAGLPNEFAISPRWFARKFSRFLVPEWLKMRIWCRDIAAESNRLSFLLNFSIFRSQKPGKIGGNRLKNSQKFWFFWDFPRNHVGEVQAKERTPKRQKITKIHIFSFPNFFEKTTKKSKFCVLGDGRRSKKLKIDSKPPGNHFSNVIFTKYHISGGFDA